MEWGDKVFYFDPVGGADKFDSYPAADSVLVTDIQGDHMNQEFERERKPRFCRRFF